MGASVDLLAACDSNFPGELRYMYSWFFGQRTGTRPPRVSSSRQWARASQPIQMQIDAAAREGSRTGGFYRDGSSRALRTTGVPFPARGGPAQPRQVQISPRGPGEFYFARAREIPPVYSTYGRLQLRLASCCCFFAWRLLDGVGEGLLSRRSRGALFCTGG